MKDFIDKFQVHQSKVQYLLRYGQHQKVHKLLREHQRQMWVYMGYIHYNLNRRHLEEIADEFRQFDGLPKGYNYQKLNQQPK